MSLVPSHDWLRDWKPAGNPRLLIDSYGYDSPFQSIPVSFQTDTVLIFTFLLTQRFLIFNIRAIHLLARCDRPIDPRAQPGGIYDILQEMAVGSCSAGIGNRRRDGSVARSHYA